MFTVGYLLDGRTQQRLKDNIIKRSNYHKLKKTIFAFGSNYNLYWSIFQAIEQKLLDTIYWITNYWTMLLFVISRWKNFFFQWNIYVRDFRAILEFSWKTLIILVRRKCKNLISLNQPLTFLYKFNTRINTNHANKTSIPRLPHNCSYFVCHLYDWYDYKLVSSIHIKWRFILG